MVTIGFEFEFEDNGLQEEISNSKVEENMSVVDAEEDIVPNHVEAIPCDGFTAYHIDSKVYVPVNKGWWHLLCLGVYVELEYKALRAFLDRAKQLGYIPKHPKNEQGRKDNDSLILYHKFGRIVIKRGNNSGVIYNVTDCYHSEGSPSDIIIKLARKFKGHFKGILIPDGIQESDKDKEPVSILIENGQQHDISKVKIDIVKGGN